MMRQNSTLTTALSLTFILAIGAYANADDGKWVSLFDGKTIEGWTKQGGYATYEAKDGMIVGTTADGSRLGHGDQNDSSAVRTTKRPTCRPQPPSESPEKRS